MSDPATTAIHAVFTCFRFTSVALWCVTGNTQVVAWLGASMLVPVIITKIPAHSKDKGMEWTRNMQHSGQMIKTIRIGLFVVENNTGKQVWTVIKGTNWAFLFGRYCYASSIPRYAAHIHFTWNLYTLGEWSIFLSSK